MLTGQEHILLLIMWKWGGDRRRF